MRTTAVGCVGLSLVLAVGAARPAQAGQFGPPWAAGLSVSNVSSGSSISGAEYSSSTLHVAWSAAPERFGVSAWLYKIRAVDGVTGEVLNFSVMAPKLSLDLSELKASTTYRIHLRACYNVPCTLYSDAPGWGVAKATYQET